MRLLLDTHALLWWLNDDAQIGPQARAAIADPANDVLVSAVSLWEIVVEVRAGKLAAEIAEITRAVERDSFALLGLTPTHLEALAALPLHADHRDPFDHLLIAQATAENATFVSADRNARHYAIRCLACLE